MAGQFERTVAVARDSQQAHRGRFEGVAFRQGKLPPAAFDVGDTPLALDRRAELLVDGSHLGRAQLAVAYAGEAEEVTRKLCAVRVQNKGPAHAQRSTEKAGFEDDVVPGRRLARFGGRSCRRAVARPVV